VTFLRWIPSFFAFPLGGFVAIETVGPLVGPAPAALGGAVVGALVGAAQWIALRRSGSPARWAGARWAGVTAAAMAVGMALAVSVTGAGTGLVDVTAVGLVAGSVVGAAQSVLLVEGARLRAVWTAVVAVSWSLGWLATWLVIVDIDRGYHVFGAAGALLVTVVTALAAGRLRGDVPAPAARPAPAVPGARGVEMSRA
jgi:hypothetical protein